jgi:hypothetical protein
VDAADLDDQCGLGSFMLRRALGGAGRPGVVGRAGHPAPVQIEADHGRLKVWLRAMRGLKQDCSARMGITGHAFVQNVRRGYYELADAEPANGGLAAALDELAVAICPRRR